MKKFLLPFFVFVVFCLCVLWAWWSTNLSPVSKQDITTQSFTITPGTNLRAVATSLQSDGLIRNSFVFLLYMKMTGLDQKVQGGDFTLSKSFSVSQISQTLIHGSEDVWIVIPEGLRADEIADLLKQKLPNYTEAWRPQLDLHEGYLFPDTYSVQKDATVEQIITLMTNNFNEKWQEAVRMQTTTLTQNQAVILASIVQRETVTPEDMRLVASVLENRLSIGMPLGSDVTLEYALGYQSTERTWWKNDLTVADLALQTPYNTRLNAGLPPTPISNPGLVALEAVLNPAKTDYLYYISDAKGVMHYATTLAGHNANIEKYGL